MLKVFTKPSQTHPISDLFIKLAKFYASFINFFIFNFNDVIVMQSITLLRLHYTLISILFKMQSFKINMRMETSHLSFFLVGRRPRF